MSEKVRKIVIFRLFPHALVVKICYNFSKNPKVFEKYADIQNVRQKKVHRKERLMYGMWPGCYSFREEIGLFALWLKEQTEALILKIYELDRMIHS